MPQNFSDAISMILFDALFNEVATKNVTYNFNLMMKRSKMLKCIR